MPPQERADQFSEEFRQSPDGLVHEAAVRQMVQRLKDHFPGTDEHSLEAHLMLELTHGLLANMRAAQWSGSSVSISGRRFPVLRLLYLADGRRLKMGTIAANLGIGTNNTTQLVDGLVREGLVERVTDPADKRVIYAALTPEGEALFAEFFPRNAGRVRDAWAPLSQQEKDVLVHLLARVRQNLLAAASPADGPASANEGTRLPSISKMSQPLD